MKKLLVLLTLAALAFTACSSEKAQKASDDASAQAESASAEAKVEAGAAVDDVTTVDVFDTLVKTGNHSTLIAAVEAAGLKDALKAPGPVTLFAPTDDAFKKVDQATLQQLLTPEGKDTLTKILTLHVVNGKVVSGDLKTEDVVTLNGQSVPVVVGEESVTFGPAAVTSADLNASNGVVHEIDTVVMPAQ